MRKIIALFLAVFLLVPVDICAKACGDESFIFSESGICTYDETLYSKAPVDSTLGIGDKFEVGNVTYQVIEYDKTNRVFKAQVGTGERGSGESSKSKSSSMDLYIPDTVIYNGDKYDVVSISKGAFYSTQFFLIDIGDNVETIEEEAFKLCQYTYILNLGEKVRNIENSAFEGCKCLGNLYAGRNIKKIGNNAFKDCESLCVVDIDGELSQLGKRAFKGCEKLKDVKLGLIAGTIEKETFQDCNSLKKIVLEGRLTAIKERAFKNCYMLSEINFDYGLKFINAYAFENCSSLKRAEMPQTLTEVGEGAFRCCNKLENVILNDIIRHIGSNAFEYCAKLISIRIPYSVEYIGERAFKGCEMLAEIEVDMGNPNYSSTHGVLFNKDQTTLIKFPEGIFLREYKVPDTVRIIGRESCINCNLEYIRFNSMTRIIEESAFCGSDLRRVDFGEGLERIERRAFANSPSLNYVVIPKDVRYIGDEAFFSYFGAADIYVMGKKDESGFIDGVGKRWQGSSTVEYI